jgi:hypothetical protein
MSHHRYSLFHLGWRRWWAQNRPRIVTDEEVRREDAEGMRATFVLSPEMRRIVEQLATDSGTDEADVFRRAVALLKVVKDAEWRGETAALVNKDGAITTTITGI